MAAVSRRAVWAAGAALIALALIGAYQGWRRGTQEADVAASTDGLLPTTNAVAARQAAPLAEPPPPILTEAQIRTIARQEAQAAMTRPASTADSEGPSPAPPVSRPAPAPAPERPIANPPPVAIPAPTPDASNAPLY